MKSLVSFIVFFLSFTTLARSLECAGTEPFWDITIEDKMLTFITPDGGAIYRLSPTISDPTAMTEVFVPFHSQDYLLIMRDSTCDDGMTSKPYTHHAAFYRKDDEVSYDDRGLLVGGGILYGCCLEINSNETKEAK